MSEGAERVRVVLVTAPDVATATRIARTLVEERWIACANLVPGVRSIYRWQGRVEDEAEVLLVLKTTAERCDALAARVKDLHPYDLPEVIAVPAVGGSEAYLAWVVEGVADDEPAAPAGGRNRGPGPGTKPEPGTGTGTGGDGAG